jgi:DNA-binding NarL/FixJ family response regulator
MADAVSLALDSGDTEGALRVIADGWQDVVATDGARLRDLVEALPFSEWNTDPWLLTALGASYRSLGSPSRSAALPYFRTAEALASGDAGLPVLVAAGIRTHHAAALRSLGRLDAAGERATTAWRLLDEDVSLPSSERVCAQARVAIQLGLVELHGGDYDSALTHLRLALGLSDRRLSPTELIECLAGLAFLSYTTGDFDGALDLVAQARAGGPARQVESRFGALALVTELLIAIERNQLLEATALADRVAAVTVRTDWEPLGLYAIAGISIISGQHIEGLDHLRRAAQLTQTWTGHAAVTVLCDGMRGTLFMHLGELDAATEIIRGLHPTQNHANCPARFLASIRFQAEDYLGCLEELEECLALGEHHSSRTMIDVLLLKAAANYELGNPVAADVAFDRALLYVSRTRMRTPFTLVPAAIMKQMLSLAADRRQPSEVSALLRDMSESYASPQYEGIEPLSDREVDVARRLYLDKTMSEIAADLFISTNTVKTHVRSIYRKLEASNRKDAVRRVRELGLHLEITPS